MIDRFAGAEWLSQVLKMNKKPPMSDLGKDVAELLGYWSGGLYHIQKDVIKTDWTNNHWIELKLSNKSLATFDGNDLTTLVFLAHRCAIRVEISACSKSSLLIMFHRRSREGNLFNRHPKAEDALNIFNQHCYLPEA